MTPASALQSRPNSRQGAPAATLRPRTEMSSATGRHLKPVPLFVAAAEEDDEFRMNLGDLPRLSPSLHVDGFQHSLLTRVLDLIDRLRKR